MKSIKTFLHYYRFDISQADQKVKYLELCQQLEGKGLIKFDSISSSHSKFYTESIAPLDGQLIELETDYLFNNQWNTAKTETSEKGLRVFDWAEPIYPNRSIKEGMYIEQTEEMREIRENTYRCGYCGKNHYKPTIQFCESCIGSEYLTEDNFPLLELAPVSTEKRKKLPLPVGFIEKYNEAQLMSRSVRLKKQQEQKKASLKAEIKASVKEYKAFSWLISHNLDFDNVIYYNHTDTFSFGWRKSLSDTQKENLKVVLINFPYKWEFSKK